MKYSIAILALFSLVITQLSAQNSINNDSTKTIIKSNNMKIIAIEKDVEGVDWNSARELLEDEARQVYQLYLRGLLREIYFNENKNAILILECENREVAAKLLNTLPLVQKGFTRFDLMELKPYTGYGRLMNLK